MKVGRADLTGDSVRGTEPGDSPSLSWVAPLTAAVRRRPTVSMGAIAPVIRLGEFIITAEETEPGEEYRLLRSGSVAE